MKRCLLPLALLLLLTLTLSSCRIPTEKLPQSGTTATETSGVTEDVTDAVTDAPLPDGYTAYHNGAITFAYPEAWTLTKGSVDLIVNETGVGNNVSVSYEAFSDLYSGMDVASFRTTLQPALESSGMTVADPSVEQCTNPLGTKLTRIHYQATYNGVSMEQTMLILAAGEYNYVVSVTEVTSDDALLENVYRTLKAAA